MTPRAIQPANYYVALGSSFAAGPGLRPRANRAPFGSGRSERNYAHLLADRRSLRLADMSFSGATTADLLAADRRGTPAQVLAIDKHTSLVTVTAGGNDVGYLPALTLGSLPRTIQRLPRVRRRITQYLDADATEERFAALHASLSEVVSHVHDRAPNARILIVDYLRILPEADVPTTPAERVTSWARTTASSLTRTFAAVAAETDAIFVDLAEISRSHHAWSAEPWVRRFHYTLHNGAPYHPNIAGMAAVADRVDSILR